jgi:hypothetical protein
LIVSIEVVAQTIEALASALAPGGVIRAIIDADTTDGCSWRKLSIKLWARAICATPPGVSRPRDERRKTPFGADGAAGHRGADGGEPRLGAALFAAKASQVPVFNAHTRYRAFIVAKTTPATLAAAATVRALKALVRLLARFLAWFRDRRIISAGAFGRNSNAGCCDHAKNRSKD